MARYTATLDLPDRVLLEMAKVGEISLLTVGKSL